MVTTEGIAVHLHPLLYFCLHQQFCSFHKSFVSKEEKMDQVPLWYNVYCCYWSYIWDKFGQDLTKSILG